MGLTIYLINGYQVKGLVKGFDNYTIIMERDDKQQLIYKHAISTIIPNSPIDLLNKDVDRGGIGKTRSFKYCLDLLILYKK